MEQENATDIDTDITEKQIDFIYYFMRQTDKTFTFYHEILEDNEANDNALSATAGALSRSAQAIPQVGKLLSGVVEKVDKERTKKVREEEAFTLAGIVFRYMRKKKEIKKILIQAAYEVFCSYEAQFANVTCKGGTTRAMYKLGCEASLRLVHYLLAQKITSINMETVIDGMICNPPKKLANKLRLEKYGRTVANDGKKWSTSQFFTEPGLICTEEGVTSFYKNDNTNSLTFGHRRKFAHENLQDWSVDKHCSKHEYLTDFANFDTDYAKIKEYLATKDPEEFAKYDRSIKHEEILTAIQDLGQNGSLQSEEIHQKTLKHSEKLSNQLKDEHQKTREEIADALQKFEGDKMRGITDEVLMALENIVERRLEDRRHVDVTMGSNQISLCPSHREIALPTPEPLPLAAQNPLFDAFGFGIIANMTKGVFKLNREIIKGARSLQNYSDSDEE